MLYSCYCTRHQIAHKGDSKWLLVIRSCGITHYQIYKLANDKDITTDVIGAICTALEVEPNDIMDFIQEIDK